MHTGFGSLRQELRDSVAESRAIGQTRTGCSLIVIPFTSPVIPSAAPAPSERSHEGTRERICTRPLEVVADPVQETMPGVPKLEVGMSPAVCMSLLTVEMT